MTRKYERKSRPNGRQSPANIHLRVSHETKRRLTTEAERRGVTVSQLLLAPWLPPPKAEPA